MDEVAHRTPKKTIGTGPRGSQGIEVKSSNNKIGNNSFKRSFTDEKEDPATLSKGITT